MIKIGMHICMITFILYIAYLSKPGSSLFSFHPFCMSVGYGLLMTEAILTMTNQGIWQKTTLKTRVFAHWVLNTFAGVTAIAGVSAIYVNKDMHGHEHFISYHAICGGISNSYLLIQLTAGILAKYPHLLKSFVAVKKVKQLHSLSGTCSYSLGLLALFLAFSTTWFQNNSTPIVAYLGMTMYCFILFYVITSVLKKYEIFPLQKQNKA